jgi:hypothetical protein
VGAALESDDALIIFDLHPASRTGLKLVKSVHHKENDGHEDEGLGPTADQRGEWREERKNNGRCCV